MRVNTCINDNRCKIYIAEKCLFIAYHESHENWIPPLSENSPLYGHTCMHNIAQIFSLFSCQTKPYINTKILFPINPCSIHGNELRQIHLITGAPHGVNPSLIKLLGVCLYMGRIYALLVVKVSMHMLGNPWSFVIHMGMNYVKFT